MSKYEKMKDILFIILPITLLVSLLSTIIFVLASYEHWQKGFYAHEWLESGIEEVDELLDYTDIMDFTLIETISEIGHITYHYLITTYKEYNSDLIGDIDIYYMEKNDIDVYITFENDKHFWNKFGRNGTIGLSVEKRKYTYCEDFDVAIEVHNMKVLEDVSNNN